VSDDQRIIIVDRAVDLVEHIVGHRFNYEQRAEVTRVLDELRGDAMQLAGEIDGWRNW
jgi:hypothetical protein